MIRRSPLEGVALIDGVRELPFLAQLDVRPEIRLAAVVVVGVHTHAVWYSSFPMSEALQAPLRQIAENAGVDGSVVAGKVIESNDPAFGFNAQTEEYGDMYKFGVIDPAKVVRTALQDAASVAGLLITTEAMIADKPEPKGQAGGGMPGGMGGMGDMM